MLVKTENRLPIKIWAEEEDTVGYEDSLIQASNLANHPLAFKYICLMPDFHVGYGMPIGGVFATLGGIVPNAVGVDIGCNVLAVRTSCIDLDRETLQQLRLEIHQQVPVGFTHRTEPSPFGFMPRKPEEGFIVDSLYDNASLQLGTLGGGNHFIEIQKDNYSFVWVMIHSGSRNIGKAVCDFYSKEAKRLCDQWKVTLPNADLAFLAEGSPFFYKYLGEMQWCMKFAKANLYCMVDHVAASFFKLGLPWEVSQEVYTMHNYASQEHHFNSNPWIHRKGAVRARGLVCIPGSMGTASYIGEGLNNPQSFCSCSHGAGRVLGRREANRTITKEDAVAMMGDVVFGIRDGDYDEMPRAYKDIERVMDNQSDLVTRAIKLTPLAVVKG